MRKMQFGKDHPIAVMDSGLGGISVLGELFRVMPKEDYLYFGDSLNAPYGEKPPEEIIAICRKNTEMLLSMGAKCLVIACNTATSAAAEILRAEYPELPVIGMEPAVKPAAKHGIHPRVLVLATPITIKGDRLHHLVEAYGGGAELILREAPGIVRFVEAGICDANPNEALRKYLRELLSEFRKDTEGEADSVDAVVLGCTHFPFVREEITKALGYQAAIYDGSRGTALQTKRRLLSAGLLREDRSKKTQETVLTFRGEETGAKAAGCKIVSEMPADFDEAVYGESRIRFMNSDPHNTAREKQLFELLIKRQTMENETI